MKIETKYSLYAPVIIVDLNLKGIIKNIMVSAIDGLEYKVEYFYNCEQKFCWLTESQLKAAY